MAITEAELRRGIAAEEPDYPGLARRIDASNTALLAELARGDDAMTASKAVYLASLSADPRAHDIVSGASRSMTEVVRIAAASAIDNLPAARRLGLVEQLLADDSVSVQKLTLRSIDQIRLKQALPDRVTGCGNEIVGNTATGN